jgi:hypothetical protein
MHTKDIDPKMVIWILRRESRFWVVEKSFNVLVRLWAILQPIVSR